MSDNRGFAAIVPILLVGGLVLALAQGMSFRAGRQVMADIGHVAGAQATHFADACVEIALNKLQTVLNYAGNESVTANGIACDILPITGTGNYNRVITARASVRGFVRKIVVMVTKVSFPTVIASWKEVPD